MSRHRSGAVQRRSKQVSAYNLLLPLVLGAAGCGGTARSEQEARPVAARVVTPVRETLRTEASYLGTLTSTQEATVVARTAGTLAELTHREGEEVREGELLAVVAAPENAARIQRAASDAHRLRTEADHACSDLERDRRLVESGALPEARLAQSEARCTAARSGLSAASAGVVELRRVDDKRRERAPFDGVVLDWLAEPGENLVPGRPILRVGGTSMEVRVAVVEQDLRRGVRVGAPVRLELADGRTVDARVSSMAPASRGPAHTVEVTVALSPEQTEGLPHGSSADVLFVLAEAADALTLPLEAIRGEDGNHRVYVVDDGVARQKDVRVVLESDGRAAVEGPLEESSQVIAGEVAGLVDGLPVYAVAQSVEKP